MRVAANWRAALKRRTVWVMEGRGRGLGVSNVNPSTVHWNNMGFTSQKSILSLLLAQPYCIQKVLHEGRSFHIIKRNKKTIHKNQYLFKKYQGKKRKYTYKKVLYNVDKTAPNCYKKVEELCEAAPYCWRFAPDSFYSSAEVEAKGRSQPPSFPPSTSMLAITVVQ